MRSGSHRQKNDVPDSSFSSTWGRGSHNMKNKGCGCGRGRVGRHGRNVVVEEVVTISHKPMTMSTLSMTRV